MPDAGRPSGKLLRASATAPIQRAASTARLGPRSVVLDPAGPRLALLADHERVGIGETVRVGTAPVAGVVRHGLHGRVPLVCRDALQARGRPALGRGVRPGPGPHQTG